MLRFLLAAAAVAGLAAPALAADFALTIRNNSSQAVTRLNTFAVGKDGAPVEDNLGALMEDLPAGATGRIVLDIIACQPVYIALGLGGSDDDLTTTIDTCKDKTLVVSD